MNPGTVLSIWKNFSHTSAWWWQKRRNLFSVDLLRSFKKIITTKVRRSRAGYFSLNVIHFLFYGFFPLMNICFSIFFTFLLRFHFHFFLFALHVQLCFLERQINTYICRIDAGSSCIQFIIKNCCKPTIARTSVRKTQLLFCNVFASLDEGIWQFFCNWK